MKICYFNGGMDVPSVRFRMPFYRLLERRRHQCTYLTSMPSRYEYNRLIGWRASEYFRQALRRWHIAQVADEKFASVVLETGIFHNDDYSFEQELRAAAGRLIYDIDDAVFLLFPKKTEAIATMADRVIAGNQKIADWAMQFNQCVTVIPTCVDETDYGAKRYDQATTDNQKPIVGWIGSRGNVKMLSVCAPALREVSSKRQFELRVMTSDKSAIDEVDLAGVNVRWININRSDAVAELQQFDIGLMPLPADDPWMEYKCNAKMIQYMSVGIPSIGSAIGFNLELVDDNVNSLLAADHDGWVHALDTLLDSPELRQSLGRKARESVLKSYTVQSRIEEYERAILGSKFNPEKHQWRLAK